MNISWRRAELPRRGIELGHGAGIACRVEHADEPVIVAFVDGFDWRRGQDTEVRYDPQRFPPAQAGDALRAAFEQFLRAGQCPYSVEFGGGYALHLNA